MIATNAGSPPNLLSLSLTSMAQALVSGADLFTSVVRGAGPLVFAPLGMAVDPSRQVIFVSDPGSGSLLAVDLVSGDRVTIAN